MAKVLMIIAPEGFQEVEYGIPKELLEKKGHEVLTASSAPQPRGHLGNILTADLTLSEVNPDEYSAIAFVGGPGASFYFDHQPALALAQEFYKAGKVTAAICAAPTILAKAGLLNGKNATCYPSQSDNLESNGANYTAKALEIDGLLITANGPESAKKFGKALHKAIK
jgi:deglycase